MATSTLQTNTVLFWLLVLTGATSAILISLAIVALLRRQSRSYFFIVIALGTLICKVFAGGLTIVELLPSDLHHTMEHGLDLIMGLLLLAAIYAARTAPRSPNSFDE